MSIFLSVISRAEAIRNVTIAAIIIVALCLWAYTHTEDATRKYISHRVQKFYFCGHPMQQIFQQNLMDNLDRFLDQDFSDIYALLLMLMLKDNRSARLVRCKFKNNSGEYWHHWVEFRYFGTWYALDPDWYDCLVVPRRSFDHMDSSGHDQICNHREFWSHPVFAQFHRKLQCQQTSYLLVELCEAADPDRCDSLHLGEHHGRQFRPLSLGNGRVVTSEIFDFLMEHRDYYEPPATVIVEAMKEKDRFIRPPKREVKA